MFGEPSSSGNGDGGLFTFVKEKKDKKDKRAKDKTRHDLDSNSNVMRPLGADTPAAAGIFQSGGGSSAQLPPSAFSFELLGTSSSSAPQQSNGVSSSPAAASIFGEQQPMTTSRRAGGDTCSSAGVRAADDFEFDDRQEAAAVGVCALSKPSDPLLAKLLHGGAAAAAEAHRKAQSIHPSNKADSSHDSSSTNKTNTDVSHTNQCSGGGGSKFFSSMLKAKAERAQRLESAASDRLRREGVGSAENDHQLQSNTAGGDDKDKSRASTSTRIKPIITASYKAFLEEDVKRRAAAALKAATRKTDESGIRGENGLDDADDEPLGEAFNDLLIVGAEEGKTHHGRTALTFLDKDETDDTFYFRSDWGLRVEKKNPTTSHPSSTTDTAHECGGQEGNDGSAPTASKKITPEVTGDDSERSSSHKQTHVQTKSVDAPESGSEIDQKSAEEGIIVLSAAVADPQKSARERVANIRTKRQRELENSLASLFGFFGRANASSFSPSSRISTRPAAELSSGMASLLENDFYGRVAASLVA